MTWNKTTNHYYSFDFKAINAHKKRQMVSVYVFVIKIELLRKWKNEKNEHKMSNKITYGISSLVIVNTSSIVSSEH